MALLTTATGKQCVITNSRRATYGYDQRIEVHGSKGMARADNPRPTTLEVAGERGYARDPLHDFFMTRYTAAYIAEIEGFVAWLAGADADVPGGADGLRALELADAAVRSLESGRVEKV